MESMVTESKIRTKSECLLLFLLWGKDGCQRWRGGIMAVMAMEKKTQ
jgi:hypothetical protein